MMDVGVTTLLLTTYTVAIAISPLLLQVVPLLSVVELPVLYLDPSSVMSSTGHAHRAFRGSSPKLHVIHTTYSADSCR
jgi:hypothetical protein